LAVALAQANLNPKAAMGASESFEFRVDGEVLHADVRDGAVGVAAGPAANADAIIEGDADSLLAWGAGQIDDTEALRSGLRASGGRRTLRRLRALFPPTSR